MATTECIGELEVTWIDHEEGVRMHAERAAEELGVSVEELLERWHAGEYDHLIDDLRYPELLSLSIVI